MTYAITSEDASNHWGFLNTKNHVVLDLGCGMWDITNTDENTSVYFAHSGATKVIGIDSDPNTLEHMKNSTQVRSLVSTLQLIDEKISDAETIARYLNDFGVTLLKCDIEGSESVFENITTDDMKNVQEVAIEYHSLTLRDMLVRKLEEWGFKQKDTIIFFDTPVTNSSGVLYYSR